MRKHLKQAFAVVLVLALCLSLTGCYSEANAWAAKSGEESLPIGSYIYFLNSAYTEAATKVSSEEEVLKATIEDQDAETWIRNRAKNYLLSYYFIDSEFSRLGLELTADDLTEANESTDSLWSYSQSYFEEKGIAKESFHKAYSLYGIKYQMVMEALYAEDGEMGVSKEELQTYFNDNYSYYDYFSVNLKNTDDDGNSTDMTDEEKAEVKEHLEALIADINSGKVTLEEAASSYAEEYLGGEDNTTYSSPYAVLTSNLSETISTALDGVKDNQAVLVENGSYYLVMCPRSLADGFEDTMEGESGRDSMVSGLKGEEFADYVEEKAESVEGVTINESALKRIKLSSVVTDSNKNGTSTASSAE